MWSCPFRRFPAQSEVQEPGDYSNASKTLLKLWENYTRKDNRMTDGEKEEFVPGKYVRTEAIRRKMSLSHIGKTVPDEVRKKISEAITGTKRSAESVEKGASKRRGENHFHFGKPRTDDEKRKTSESLKYYYMTEEGKAVRRRLSEIRSRLRKSPEEKAERERRHNREKRKILKSILIEMRSGGCINCGEKHPGCLDWHHIDQNDKDKPVSRIYSMGMKKALDFLESECKKCVVLCSNCHRKLHWENGTRGIKKGDHLTTGV